jgi:DNA-directed RNA polymerase subunit RPC12/RpoP
MPVRYVCRNCGTVLYTSIGRSDNPPSPEYIASLYGYKCPHCGVDLSTHPLRVRVRRARGRREDVRVIVDKRDRGMVTVSVRIPMWMYNEIDYWAGRKGYASKSSFIRDALLKHLKKLYEEEGEGKRPDQGEN